MIENIQKYIHGPFLGHTSQQRLLLPAVLLSVLFLSMGIHEVTDLSRYSRLNDNTVKSDLFRRQPLDEDIQLLIKNMEKPGELLAVYWLESNFAQEPGAAEVLQMDSRQEIVLYDLRQNWADRSAWKEYVSACRAVWDDLKYFPVPEPMGFVHAEVSFVDSWMYERNYGGKRGHEGTDIMARKNVRGYYPVVSMTDGVVTHKGWLEKGGYRLGITAPGGAYFYYAHLDSYAELEEGDTVKAGDLLGYMGDTGYSKTEGTTGKFPVHLHVGIYLIIDGEEISVNPYPALKYLESRKLKCVYK